VHIHINRPKHRRNNSSESADSEPTAKSRKRGPVPSSPVASDSDPEVELGGYIDYLIEQTPSQKDLLLAAKEKLLAEALDLPGIRALDNVTWARLDIPLGIGLRLQRKVKIYTKGRESTSYLSTRKSTISERYE